MKVVSKDVKHFVFVKYLTMSLYHYGFVVTGIVEASKLNYIILFYM